MTDRLRAQTEVKSPALEKRQGRGTLSSTSKAGPPAQKEDFLIDGSSTLDGVDYVYDAAGNRVSKTALPSNVASAYSYDPAYELTKVMQGATQKESYTYDAVGNRTYQPGAPYTYNVSNEMLTREGVLT